MFVSRGIRCASRHVASSSSISKVNRTISHVMKMKGNNPLYPASSSASCLQLLDLSNNLKMRSSHTTAASASASASAASRNSMNFDDVDDDHLNNTTRSNDSSNWIDESDFGSLKSLDQFPISEKTKTNLMNAGIKQLFPVQAESYEIVMSGKDILGRSKTGSGKTLAFALPIVERLLAHPNRSRGRAPRAIVLAPTRELASQVAKEFNRICPDLSCANIVGGVGFEGQERMLRNGVDIVVGTPGRIIDHLRRRNLRLDEIQVTVLDEADMMLKVGFQQEVEDIYSDCPDVRQNVLWSATMPRWVKSVAQRYMNDPHQIDLVGEGETHMPTTVQHKAICSQLEYRPALLDSIVTANYQSGRILVFTDTKLEADKLARGLNAGICRPLHGDMSQAQRDDALNHFRAGECNVLVCTDVAARGLDIPNVERVIHYRLPRDKESFLHRSGRTGRAGKSGENIVLYCGKEDSSSLQEAERNYQIKFDYVAAPSADELILSCIRSTEALMSHVDPTVRNLFKEAAEKMLQEQQTDALSSALALLNGYSREGPSTFSMLTGRPGSQTLLVEGKFTHQNDVISFLNKFGRGERAHLVRHNDIHQCRQDGFIVDVHQSIASQVLEQNLDSDVRISKPTVLPELRYRNSNHGRGNDGRYGFRGNDRRGGYRNFDHSWDNRSSNGKYARRERGGEDSRGNFRARDERRQHDSRVGNDRKYRDRSNNSKSLFSW